MKFLDYTGLKLVVEQIKTLLNKKADTSYVDDKISKVVTTPGDDGEGLDFIWDGTKLGIKKETDLEYTYTELKGTDGKTPIKGQDYFDGKSIEYQWRGTELGIRVEGQAGYQYVDLKGNDGYTPQKGVDYVDGKDFTFEDFTPEQLAKLKGETGKGVPIGGNSGEVLTKQSNGDFDTAWSKLPDSSDIDLGNYDIKYNEILDQLDFIYKGELLEENLTSDFKDTFDSGTKKVAWKIEKFGSAPGNVIDKPFEGGWQFLQETGGHGSIAMFTEIPSLIKGYLEVSFDWKPFNIDNGTSYRGSHVTLRRNVTSRGSIYGRSDYDSELIRIEAFQAENPKIENEVLPTLSSELTNYRIVINIKNGDLKVFTGDELLYDKKEPVTLDGFYLEFVYGGYSKNTYSMIDNVKISHFDGVLATLDNKGNWIPKTESGGIKTITSITEPSLSTGDQWHKEI